MRGGLRRRRESCLVNAIVLQAWEAAHGRTRDLVIGTTGPNGFRAHAWLEGDPIPTADAAELDASVLNASRSGGWSKAREAPNGSGEAGGENNGTLTPFSELLRRPAPHYEHAPSIRRS